LGLDHGDKVVVVHNALEHGAKGEAVVATKRGGESDDGGRLRRNRLYEFRSVWFGSLDSRVKAREKFAVAVTVVSMGSCDVAQDIRRSGSVVGFVDYDSFKHVRVVLVQATGAEKTLVGRHGPALGL
jgi:hypothetical protein